MCRRPPPYPRGTDPGARRPAELLVLMTGLRGQGASLREIARRLNGLGLRTSWGKQWYPGTIRKALEGKGVSETTPAGSTSDRRHRRSRAPPPDSSVPDVPTIRAGNGQRRRVVRDHAKPDSPQRGVNVALRGRRRPQPRPDSSVIGAMRPGDALRPSRKFRKVDVQWRRR
jgi:hypothetical protein